MIKGSFAVCGPTILYYPQTRTVRLSFKETKNAIEETINLHSFIKSSLQICEIESFALSSINSIVGISESPKTFARLQYGEDLRIDKSNGFDGVERIYLFP